MGNRGYKELQLKVTKVNRSYRGLQGVTRGYKGIQRVTRGYEGIQGVTGGYKGLCKITRSERRLQNWVTEVTKSYS